VIDISIIPVTYEPMEGIFVDVSGPYPMAGTQMDRYTWGDDQFRPPWG
jgi:hypothetical protein